MIDIPALIELSRICYSPSHAEKVAFQYWSTATDTHGDMLESTFDFFLRRFAISCSRVSMTGSSTTDVVPGKSCVVSWMPVSMPRVARRPLAWWSVRGRRGCACGSCDEVLRSGRQFDAVFINNAFFYVHPFRWEKVLRALRKVILPTGSLYLFDNPDLAKRHQLGMGRKRMLLTTVLPVYQPKMAGFFMSARRLERAARRAGFESFAILDSWCNYRTHFVMH